MTATGDKTEMQNALVVFQGKSIRRLFYNREWHFSVIDLIAALTDSSVPRRY